MRLLKGVTLLLAVVGLAMGVVYLSSGQEDMFADMSSRTVVNKTTTGRHWQEKVWTYDPITGEWVKFVTRKEAAVMLADRITYPHLAIVVPNKHGVYEFPVREVTEVINKSPKAQLVSSNESPAADIIPDHWTVNK